MRPARPTWRIRDIHHQGTVDRVATLDSEPHTLDEQRECFQRYWPRDPVVAEVDGEVIGWASLNPFSPRAAYQFVADLSVYIERQ